VPLQSRILPKAFPYAWVEGTLIVLLAILCARLFWAAFVPLGPVGNWAGPPAATLNQGAGILTRFDPFFRLSAQPGTSVVTSLPVKLFGVRVDQATGRGSAIIATPDGLQSSYAVGDEIMPGITLKAVSYDNVTITRSGNDEQLFLDQSVVAVVATTSPTAPLTVGGTSSVEGGLTARALRAGVSFAPRLEKGAVTGFVVSASGDGSAFRTVGLQPGDIVTQINGRGIRSVEDFNEAVSSPPNAGQIVFLVERGGKTVTLNAQVAP